MSNNAVFFKWSPKYSVNIKSIDAQHRELVNIVNRLCNAVTRREGNKAIAEILDALTSYTQSHFRLEESLMHEAKFEDYEAHKLEHQQLLQQLDQLCTKHLFEETPIYFEMLTFLKSWLKGHLLGEVGKYSAVLQRGDFSVSEWEQSVSHQFGLMPNIRNEWWRFWA